MSGTSECSCQRVTVWWKWRRKGRGKGKREEEGGREPDDDTVKGEDEIRGSVFAISGG